MDAGAWVYTISSPCEPDGSGELISRDQIWLPFCLCGNVIRIKTDIWNVRECGNKMMQPVPCTKTLRNPSNRKKKKANIDKETIP